MKSVFRTLISFDNLMIVLATCVAVVLLYVIPRNFDFLSPVSAALGDVDITDLVFSQFRDETEVTPDTNIVIVNIGHLDRAGIAAQIDRIAAEQPAVIGIDAFFRQPKDDNPEGDTMLADVLRRTPNVVLVSKLIDADTTDEEDAFDALETSHPMFTHNVRAGYANIIIDDEASFLTCREVSFKEHYAGKTATSFPVVLAQHLDPQAAQKALQREENVETINYRGGLAKYYHFDVDQILDPETDLSILRGKVVLMGYLGTTIGSPSLEDIFFTPLNERYAGRSLPDMHGIVIHANVLSMILHGSYIDRMSDTMAILVGLVVLISNVLLFTYIYSRFENWYDTLALVLQLGQSLFILYLTIVVFDERAYKLDLTPALLGVALVGTVHDLYQDSLKKLILGAIAQTRRRTVSKSPSDRTDTVESSADKS